MYIKVKHNLWKLPLTTKNLAKQVKFAQSVALTRIAKRTVAVEQRVMRSVFDRPKPFTVRAVTWHKIKVGDRNYAFEVGFRQWAGKGSPAGKYLQPQVLGGERRAKRSESLLRMKGHLKQGEYLIPGRGAPLDQYGNVRGSVYSKMLSNLGATWDLYQRTRPGRRSRSKQKFFFDSGQGRGKSAGIFIRQGQNIKRVFSVVDRPPQYKKRFPFFEVGQKVFDKHWEREFRSALDHALKTAKP